MEVEVTNKVFEVSKSGVSNSEIPFDLFQFTKDQLKDLKNLVLLDKQSEEFHSKKCNVCGKDFSEYKYMRNHQSVMHFNILRKYTKMYGNFFEKYLERF